jgi:hypothetical protein
MKEVVSVKSELVDSECASNEDFEKHNQRQSMASDVIELLAASSFKRLLAPYYTKILTFQCGIKARILSHGFLLSNNR